MTRTAPRQCTLQHTVSACMMVRATLLQYGAELWPKLGRIVFIATPHYGATAIAGYLKNHFWGTELMALLGLYLSRETLRSLWGVLGLLPAPLGVYPGTRGDDRTPWTSGSAGDVTPIHAPIMISIGSISGDLASMLYSRRNCKKFLTILQMFTVSCFLRTVH